MEQGSDGGTSPPERIDLAAEAGSPAVAWVVALVAALVAGVGTYALLSRVGLGSFAVLGGLVALYLVSWWRVTRLCSALEHHADAAVLRVRVRRGLTNLMVWAGANTELVVHGGTVVLGEESWPAGSVSVGRPPSFWSARSIELLTPTGPVGVSFLPKGDVGVYLASILDRRAAVVLGRVLVAQSRPPAGWYADPDDPGARRWWDGAAWGARAG